MTGAERILGWLRDATAPLSGEELADRLGCTRAAVHKHVAALRRSGYAIAAHHARGYSLASVPDRLGPAELAPYLTGSWRTIEWYDEVESTQHVARAGRRTHPRGRQSSPSARARDGGGSCGRGTRRPGWRSTARSSCGRRWRPPPCRSSRSWPAWPWR